MKKINLNDIPKQDPFLVPEGYLDELPQSIQQRVVHAPATLRSENATRLWMFLPKLQMAYSLVLLLLVMLVIFQQPQNSPDNAQTILEQVDEQELVNYLSNKGKLDLQELSLEKNWQEADIYDMHPLTTEDVLEKEILQDLDTYTAEDLWK